MLLHAVLALEPFDAARGINEALGAGVVRMALRADLDMQLAQGRAGLESIAAGARYRAAAIVRMNSSFNFTTR